jgi:uncharacterized protein (TIGR03435 family)
MRIARLAVLVLSVAAATSTVFTQASPQSSPAGPTFEVVSIKPNVTDQATGRPLGSNVNQRPDGGFTMTNIPVGTLISRAYPFAAPIDMVGLPRWAMSERYDVSATSSLSSPTPDDRTAMLRAILADRFKLAVRIENRAQPAYDLVLARRDGRLGRGIKPVDIDCDARIAAERAAAEAARNAGTPPRPQLPDFNAPPPPCTLRTVGASLRDRVGDRQGRLGDLLEGETTMANLADALRPSAGRVVVNKTGLSGSYRVTMNFDSMAARRGPDATGLTTDGAPSVFTAIQEQLGLKLESSRALRETLVIDRLERPTEN